jgi:CheY-like chemotaxis protein
MGLAAVLGIVRGHDGGIQVDTRPGEGTRIRVLLPCAPESARRSRALSAEARAGIGPRTVLVVDDEEVVRALSRNALEDSGFRVLTAADGAEAVQVVRRHRDSVDLVLLDLTMPRMGGEEAFREIRKLRDDLPVILCSGYSESEGTAVLAGRDQATFLHKPFRVADLLRTVRTLLEG